MPCPNVRGAFLNHCRRYTSFYLGDEVPVKLEENQGTTKALLLFREAFRLSNQPANSFPQDAIKILNVNRFHIIPIRITIHNSDLFFDESSISISYFHQLTIIELFNFEETRKSISIVIVSVSEYLDFFSSPWAS